jgi:AcrR family transcriptional regulator
VARTVDEEAYTAKRNEILDVMQRFMFTQGYENMSIKDILRELEISSGAFYHYFDSKPALLDAFIARIKEKTEEPFLPILNNPELTAIEKLQGFFNTLDNTRMENRADIVKLSQIWYTDANTIVRQKVDEAIIKQRAPLLTEIVHQGVQEGVFTTPYPDLSGEVILSLFQGMGNMHAQLLFSGDQDFNQQQIIEKSVAVYDAYMNAIERFLGAPTDSLRQSNTAEAIEGWVKAAQEAA